MIKPIILDSHIIGEGKVFIVAELSANHNGKLENALKAVHAAKKAGADAIKIQTYTADTITIDCDNDYFQINSGTIWDGTTLYKLYQNAGTPFEWHKPIFEEAHSVGITCFSSPFDGTAVELLEDLNCPAYKIASPEITDLNLIRLVARTGKPVIISTGIASLADIELAIRVCKEESNHNLIVLKCTAEYPAPIHKSNLATIKNISETYGVHSGLSDHTMGITVPVLSVALGATMIEKHFITDRELGGPDSSFSLDFKQFNEMVTAVREAELAIGQPEYKPIVSDLEGKGFMGRSLFVVENMRQGEAFTKQNIRSIRPGYGLNPKFLDQIIGSFANEDLERGTPLAWRMIKESTG